MLGANEAAQDHYTLLLHGGENMDEQPVAAMFEIRVPHGNVLGRAMFKLLGAKSVRTKSVMVTIECK